MASTEYDYIEVIGSTNKEARNKAESYIVDYYHRNQERIVRKILTDQKFSNFAKIIDLVVVTEAGMIHGNGLDSKS